MPSATQRPSTLAIKVREVFTRGTREATELAVGDLTYSIELAPITSADYVNLYFTDITDSADAPNSRWRESEQRYRSVIEALPAAVYTTDADGRVTMFNQAAVDFSGRTPEVGIGFMVRHVETLSSRRHADAARGMPDGDVPGNWRPDSRLRSDR